MFNQSMPGTLSAEQMGQQQQQALVNALRQQPQPQQQRPVLAGTNQNGSLMSMGDAINAGQDFYGSA